MTGQSTLPPSDRVSAVFLLAMNDERILAVRNERGGDIPGGHVRPDETLAAALARETLEEAAATFAWAEPFAIISVPDRSQVMLCYVTSAFDLATFVRTEDAVERTLLGPLAELMRRYCGPIEVLAALVRGRPCPAGPTRLRPLGD